MEVCSWAAGRCRGVRGLASADGALDVVTANRDDGTISTLLNDGDGVYAAGVQTNAGARPITVAIADIDEDGLGDVFVVDQSTPGSIRILRSLGAGSYSTLAVLPAGNNPRGIVVADLDGDGDLDIATANQQSYTVSVFDKTGAPPSGPSGCFRECARLPPSTQAT